MTVEQTPTSLRTQAENDYPDFPWLSLESSERIADFLARHGWLLPEETVQRVSKAGEGNMNLTLRVETNERSFILKQARPWVEKYDHIAAPWNRAQFEKRFYDRVSGITEVASAMPKLIAADEESRCLLLEDIRNARDFTDVYEGRELSPELLTSLAGFLGHLHRNTEGKPDPQFENREMRALNHEHIFRFPLQADNGLDLDAFESGLALHAQSLMEDSEYRSVVAAMGERYLSDGPCLLHGDYFPGSWLDSDRGPIVIDPEFCFYGDREFDLGVCIAHLRLSKHPYAATQRVMNAYADAIDTTMLARFGAIEIMRRIIGVAQLPIPPSDDFRSRLLESSYRAAISGVIADLWSE